MASVTVSRVEAEDLVRLARLSTDSNVSPRLVVVFTLGIIEFFTVLLLPHDVLWIIGVSLVVAVLVIMRLDTVGVRWLYAESVSYSLVYRLKAEENLADKRPVKSRSIFAGSIVCKLEEHENLISFMAAQTIQAPAPNLGRWYRPVLITRTESGLLRLGILGREDSVRVEPDERRYFRHGLLLDDLVKLRSSHPRSAEAAQALTDLLECLSGHQQREDVVVRHLVSERGNSDWSVRNAMLLARAARLMEWGQTTPTAMKAVFLATQLFLPWEISNTGGHSTCWIKLTNLGELWRDSGPTTPEADFDISPYGRRVVNMHTGDHYTGDHYEVHGSANSVGPNNDVSGTVIDQRGHAPDGVTMQVLAGELRQLSEYLIGQANSRTQFVAIKEVEAAIDAAERNDKEEIVAHLSTLGKLSGWVVAAGKAIGVGVAVAAIDAALKIPR